MKKPIQFTIEGKPQGKARPRFRKTQNKTTGAETSYCYTPKETVNYQELVKLEYMRQCGSYYFGDNTALRVSLVIWYSIAKRTKKDIKNDMLQGILKPTKKPDIDNVIKIICDSLNGVAYKDDAQIVGIYAIKLYSETPRVEVKISEAN